MVKGEKREEGRVRGRTSEEEGGMMWVGALVRGFSVPCCILESHCAAKRLPVKEPRTSRKFEDVQEPNVTVLFGRFASLLEQGDSAGAQFGAHQGADRQGHDPEYR